MLNLDRGALVLACSLLLTSTAAADTLVITYRSGQVQQVPLAEPSEAVSSIAYRKETGVLPAPAGGVTAPTGGIPAHGGTVSGGAVSGGQVPPAEPAAPKGGSTAPSTGPKIRWAPPLNE